MSIKAGQILHDIHGFVIDRIQTGGVSSLNIPQEKVYELGNFQTVATVRDIPDLTFGVESLDVSCEMEAIITAVDPTTLSGGEEFDFRDALPIDVISPFKAGGSSYAVVRGIEIPSLTLESATYNFGVRQNSTQQFSFRGDSLLYSPGTPKQQHFTATAGANQVYTLSFTSIAYVEAGDTLYAYAVCAYNPTTNAYKRLFFGDDYTNTTTTVTVIPNLTAQGYTDIRVVYATATAGSYLQTVHQDVTVKPAAVRGKDIDVYISDGAATPTLFRWRGVQSFNINWRVNLEADEEFGNPHYVAQDYDVPDVTGSLTMKPSDAPALWDMIANVADTATNVTTGPLSSVGLEMELRIRHPDTGVQIKSFNIPDARFTIPSIEGRVQQKLQPVFNWQSDGGNLTVING